MFCAPVGDVTEFGSDVQLLGAKSILDSLDKPYHIIPGNHDTKWSESGITTFSHVFGRERWRIHTSAAVLSSPRSGGEWVFVGGSDRKMRCLESGRLRWEFGEVAGFIETRPLLYGGKVIFGVWDRCLYALDIRSGNLVWKWSGGRPGILYSPAACWQSKATRVQCYGSTDREWRASIRFARWTIGRCSYRILTDLSPSSNMTNS